MADSNSKLSVIIVTHNSGQWLKPALAALQRALTPIEAELIVVDNASIDNSPDLVKRLFPTANILVNRNNSGFARASNQAARVAGGDWLLFLNPDLIVEPDSICQLMQAATNHKRAGLVTGQLLNPDGTTQANCRNFPTPGNLIFSRGSFLSGWLGQSKRYTLSDFDGISVVPAVAGTWLLISRSLWQSHNGFDERYFMFMEDTDLSLRINQEGRENLFVPSARATHHWGEGSNIGNWRRSYYHHQSLTLYFKKHSPGLLYNFILSGIIWFHFCLSNLLRSLRIGGAK